MNRDVERRVAVPWRLVAATLACVAVGCVVATGAAGVAGIDSRALFEDFQKIADVPFYTGIISHTGIVLWYCSVAISLFAAVVLRTRPWPARRGKPDGFLLSWGLLGMVFATDDLLLLHERVVPHYLRVREELLLLAYAAVLGYLLVRWWLFITRRTPAAVLWVSLVCFGLSLASEYVSDVQTPLSIMVEDGLKLAGITLWLLYFALVGFAALAGDRGDTGSDDDFGLPGTSATVRSDGRSSGGSTAGFSNIGDESRPVVSQADRV